MYDSRLRFDIIDNGAPLRTNFSFVAENWSWQNGGLCQLVDNGINHIDFFLLEAL